MSFISLYFVLYVLFINILFYCAPVKLRNVVLAAGSLAFLFINSKWAVLWLLFDVSLAFLYGMAISKKVQFWQSRLGLGIVVCALAAPLILLKYISFFSWAIPLGISFYTLSLLSYVIDVYSGKVISEKNILQFLLFAIFFPHIVQGPIARYDKIEKTMRQWHYFNYKEFTFGWQMVLWGYFLKFVVADKAGIMVNTVYGNYTELQGVYIMAAVVLYSIQLYADFCGCVNIALGTAQTFGIQLQPNFRQPYFAESIRDFWRRWHITLSSWLRDYIYIPLGGNRKGKLVQCLNILIVFAVSGIWHGAGLTFFAWGILHGLYQVVEIIFDKRRKTQKGKKGLVSMMVTFLLITFAWMLFRAESLSHFADLIKNMFACFNPEAVLDGDAYYRMGLSRLETLPLVVGIFSLFFVDYLHEKGTNVRENIARMPMIIRWLVYLLTIISVLVFGTYGPAYSANQFIYGQF